MKIVFYAGPAFERWTPESAERDGAGGAELFLARAAKELARRGHYVTVFADTEVESGLRVENGSGLGGVAWVPYAKFKPNVNGPMADWWESDILIVWRRPEALDWDLSRFDKIYFMAQDNHYGADLTEARGEAVTGKFMVISPWHEHFFGARYPWANGRTMLTRNGLDLSYAEAAKHLFRDLTRVIWTSSPDRGLEALLDAWPVVRRTYPSAILDVCYGFKTLEARANSRQDAELSDLIGRCREKMLQPAVTYLGRLGQADMAWAYARAHAWVGPHTWDESYCQAAAEAQLGGCVLVSPKRAALATTIKRPTIWTGNLAADICEAFKRRPPLPFGPAEAEDAFGLTSVIDQWESEFGVTRTMVMGREVMRIAPNLSSADGSTWTAAKAWPTIGLCMIVKNESARIRRCLESIKPYIDHWTIVDTGSTDDTPELCYQILGGLPGALYREPWTNWAVNMTAAFELARAHTDYVWIIDADEEVHPAPGEGLYDMVITLDPAVDAYTLRHEYQGGTVFDRKRILSTKRDWSQKGIGPMQIHEYPTCPGTHTTARLGGVTIINHNDGNQGSLTPEARRARYAREAENCEAALEADHLDYRAAFYRGQSWRDAGEIDRAINAYEWRAAMVGGWDEETFVAALEAAKLRARRGDKPETVRDVFLHAWGLRPWRAEPLCYLAGYMRERRNYREALAYGQAALALGTGPGLKGETLFIDPAVYGWRVADEVCIASYWVGDYAGSLTLAEELIEHGPADQRARFETNRDHAKAKLDAK